MKTKLDRLESRLNAAGIATRRNYIRAENGSAPVLIADHDYTGPYPTRETWGQISTVDRVAARYKGLRLERRGYYQATFIWEEVAPLDYPVYLASPDHDYLGDGQKILTGPQKGDTINTTDSPAQGRKGRKTMKQISINNGATYITPAAALEEISLDTIAEYMDDDTREAVHNEIAPCTDLEFLERYLEIAPDDLIIG